ncbi:MAG: RNA polymerase factor sigma-54 [Proteobacteria bacterium]|nr:RNA polymerase factor sigma-54 [Pseudomonadota bacterium]MDA0880934.1 RNA polymerase factor sigma-54 [Pseudomonadota bacterium]
MVIKLVREFQQRQQLSMTPQLRKSIDLLQLSRIEIINKINAEIEDNPFIIKKDPAEILSPGYDDELMANLPEMVTLPTYLQNQLEDLRLTNAENKIGAVIIQSLDESGLLSIDLDELEELLEFKSSVEDIRLVLENIIQHLDPAGIGARNFKELVHLQLKRKDLSKNQQELVHEILFNPDFKNFEHAKSTLLDRFPAEEIQQTLSLIKACDLSPGLDFESIQMIYPDVEILPAKEGLDIQFIQENFPQLSLDTELEQLAKDKKNPVNIALQEKIADAKWLIRSVKKRNETVREVGELICRMQAEFLLGQSLQLNPLSNLELARELKLSPSTISRILRSKYIQTPKGAVSMRSLLSASVSKTRRVTPQQLMEEIARVISDSPQKLSDQKLVEMLNKRGFNLARRTITKYRLKLNIPNSRKR